MKHTPTQSAFKYFSAKSCQWENIPGKVYHANLPIALEFPTLGALIVHRNINKPAPKDKAWGVTHVETSFSIARAPTRAKALEKAQAVLLSQGSYRVDRAIALAKERIKFLSASRAA